MSVCVAIPTYLREQVLVDTVLQVVRQDPPADEVLVIDQSPRHEPETIRCLREQEERGAIRWIRHSTPNLPRARNRALLESRSDVVIFIDDDVLLANGFVAAHAANYRDPTVSAVAGRTVQRNGWHFPQPGFVWDRALDWRYFELDSTTRVESVANFQGCNHSVRRAAIVELGGYDENYIGRAHREDTDAALRLWRSGHRIVFDPAACLTHLAAPSGGCRIKPDKKALPEWMISFPALYFSIRHLFPSTLFWTDTLFGNVRGLVLRKDNVKHPWRLPWAAGSYLYALGLAIHFAARGPSPIGKSFDPERLAKDASHPAGDQIGGGHVTGV